MADKHWKRVERRVAKLFRVRRRMGSGCDKSTGGDDLVHPRLFVEVKYREKHSALSLWRDIAKEAKGEKKVPVAVLVDKGSQPFVICPLDSRYLRFLLNELEENTSKTVGQYMGDLTTKTDSGWVKCYGHDYENYDD